MQHKIEGACSIRKDELAALRKKENRQQNERRAARIVKMTEEKSRLRK